MFGEKGLKLERKNLAYLDFFVWNKVIRLVPLSVKGGGLRALADMSAKHVSFFGRLTKLRIMTSTGYG